MSNFRVMLKVKIKIVELWFVMTVSLSGRQQQQQKN